MNVIKLSKNFRENMKINVFLIEFVPKKIVIHFMETSHANADSSKIKIKIIEALFN